MTKQELAAENKRLREENEALRDLLAAVSEYARSVPHAVYDQQLKQFDRATDTLIRLAVVTDPDGTWAWSWGTGQGAARLRENAAEPPGYEVYVKPEQDDTYRLTAKGEAALSEGGVLFPAGCDPDAGAAQDETPQAVTA